MKTNCVIALIAICVLGYILVCTRTEGMEEPPTDEAPEKALDLKNNKHMKKQTFAQLNAAVRLDRKALRTKILKQYIDIYKPERMAALSWFKVDDEGKNVCQRTLCGKSDGEAPEGLKKVECVGIENGMCKMMGRESGFVPVME